MRGGHDPELYFSDVFGVADTLIERYGAFNISLVTDLPLFIDPFLLFNSKKPEYRQLHHDMIRYLRFLRDKSEKGAVPQALVESWYCFSEVKQTWLGFSEKQNRGRGLGRDFANSLNANLGMLFRDFGNEQITRGSHIEKLCLIAPGVGRDMISDFATNLIKDYLLRFTEGFAEQHMHPRQCKNCPVSRARFDYDCERWMPATYLLPVFANDYVILTPRDILTKDDTWISRSDLIKRFDEIPEAIENAELRASINNYLLKVLPKDRRPKRDERQRALLDALYRFPSIVDYYIRTKEDSGDQAVAQSSLQVFESDQLYVKQYGRLASLLSQHTDFYGLTGDTHEEARQRIQYFKYCMEHKGGHRLLYTNGQPIRRESDLHLMFQLVWCRTASDVSREVNDGRGHADFKISRGSADKTLVEFKLASNSHLKRSLQAQLETYQKASNAKGGFKVIVFFTETEQASVQRILQELGLLSEQNIILIDARLDNKPSGSKA